MTYIVSLLSSAPAALVRIARTVAHTAAATTGIAALALLSTAAPTSAQETFSVEPLDLGLSVTCVEMVPQLTGDSPAVDTSGDFSALYPGWHAFDGTGATQWISRVFETPAWISYDFGREVALTRYTITNNNGPSLVSRAPKDFELQGWDGLAWTTVDTRSGETGWVSGQPRTYAIASLGAYSTYRVLISDDNDPREGVVVISMGSLVFETCLLGVADAG